MNLTIVNHTSGKSPKKFLNDWVKLVMADLLNQGIKTEASQLTIVLVSSQKMRALNRQFRGKDYATDVLSFEGFEPTSLGELIICNSVVIKQAKQHKFSFHQELAYMVLHGILHLLGYDHERSKKEAKIMFKIQDDLFFRHLASLP